MISEINKEEVKGAVEPRSTQDAQAGREQGQIEKVIEKIKRVLDEAWEAEGEGGVIPAENDWDFELGILDGLDEIDEVKGVVWYTADPNCRFVVNILGRFYDVDYVTYEFTEITKEEAIEKAVYGVGNEDEARNLLGIEEGGD